MTCTSGAFWRQAFVTLAASTGMFGWGTCLGWTNIATPQLKSNLTGFDIDDEGSSWIGSIVPLGGILGSLFAGHLMDTIGRKYSLIASHIVSFIGYGIIAVASSVLVICIGRFICGISCGITVLVATVYVSEMSSRQHRGLFGCILGTSVSFGLQFIVGVGSVIPTWDLSTVACMAPIVLGLILLPLVPESPYYVVWKSEIIEDALPALDWIWHDNKNEINECLNEIQDYMKSVKSDSANPKDERSDDLEEIDLNDECLKSRDEVKKVGKQINWFDVEMIIIGCVSLMFSMITGAPALDFYMVEIFDASASKFVFSWSAIIVRTVEIISTLSGIYLSDHLGRKPLLLASGAGMAIGMAILGISFTIMDPDKNMPHYSLTFLPLIGMVIFYLFFPIGYNSVVLVLVGEMYSPSIKGLATSLANIIWWISDFLTAKIFFDFTKSLGFDGTFYLFAAYSILSIIFVQLFVQETKGKSLAEIQTVFKSQQSRHAQIVQIILLKFGLKQPIPANTETPFKVHV